MRRFTDRDGQAWDAVLGRESWGAQVVLFVPVGARRRQPLREATLGATRTESAHAELAGMDEAELLRLFERSTPKEMGGG